MNSRLSGHEIFVLEDLRQSWQASTGDLRHWLVQGALVCNVWLPVMSVFKVVDFAGMSELGEVGQLCHWEGYVPLTRHCCHRLFKRKKAYLREFACSRTSQRYVLPDSADAVDVELMDLVVFDEERLRFERSLEVREPLKATAGLSADQTFRLRGESRSVDSSFKIVSYRGEEYRFGDMQANILRLLRDAAMRGEPWQSGKLLLHKAGSQSFALSNVFKRHPIWRELIHSDRRGSYRLAQSWLTVSNQQFPTSSV